MSIWNPSDSEKENILKQHQTQYDGYATLNKTQSNMSPLTVQSVIVSTSNTEAT
jgi:hypothetical protein